MEEDATHGVALLRQVIAQGYATKGMAQSALAMCYASGEGVEADTVQAALWCQRAAKDGDATAIEFLPLILRCDFCGTTPARQLCTRCQCAIAMLRARRVTGTARLTRTKGTAAAPRRHRSKAPLLAAARHRRVRPNLSMGCLTSRCIETDMPVMCLCCLVVHDDFIPTL